MYNLLSDLLKDKKTDVTFNCFGIYHIIYMVIIFAVIILLVLLFKNKNEDSKKKLINTTINIAFSLYILDFFLMPFAYGGIDLEKLPFHICTFSCVMCFLSRHYKFLSNYSKSFALLGLVGNIIYVIYPAGVGWYQIHPLCYRVIQTLLYHGVMSAYGIFTLVYEVKELKFKDSYKEPIVLAILTLWAIFGNNLYNINGKYFNWFFVMQDPFYILPTNIAKFIMPFVTPLAMFIAIMIVYLIFNVLKRNCNNSKQKVA